MSDFQKITGAIFDVDGTLLDSMYIWNELPIRYLSAKTIQPQANCVTDMENMTLLEGCQYIQDVYHIQDSVTRIEDDMKQILAQFYCHEVSCKKEVVAYVKALSLSKIPMIIATTSDRKLVMAALHRNQIDHYFRDIITCDAYHFTKREPDIYLHAAQKINSPIHSTLVFEDAYYAMETAAKVGFIVYGVSDDTNKKERESIRKICDTYIQT